MPNYTQANLNTITGTMISGEVSAANFLIIANQAMRFIVSEVDFRSTIRKSALSPNLMDDIYNYSAPSDFKKLIDIKPQINRGKYDDWRLTTPEEFDRLKTITRTDKYGDPINVESNISESIVAIDERDFIKKIRISKAIDDTEAVVASLDAVGDWATFGDGSNITKDADNYVKGSASLNWDINADGGITAGIQNTALDEFDVSSYLSNGYAFVWAYISSATDLTNFVLRIGNDSSNYYYITITTNNEGNAFSAGWNLLRFSFSNKTETGTVDDDDCDYTAIFMTKDAGKTDETDYRFDHIILKLGDNYSTMYYSKFGWQSSAGTYLEDATDTTDLLNADTDEMKLISLKTAELLENFLRNHKEADRLEVKYERAKLEYQKQHPSQALLPITTYYNL